MGWPMVCRMGLVIVSPRVPALDLRDMICVLRDSFSVPSWRFLAFECGRPILDAGWTG
jgi:hypothetical protein